MVRLESGHTVHERRDLLFLAQSFLHAAGLISVARDCRGLGTVSLERGKVVVEQVSQFKYLSIVV